ncbi:hypothetical protein HQN87_20625 [Paenibacillus tritici]|uniref:Lipoprotein n=1 Tax=Paenibacillus tritici TaxID=1873425 RepID=A0ABX2DUH9_9BACL|nr:hypothetical protein [Paenibacillus tritici]NQX47734.1 hypothetical protein [Paenibacillus tritici]
MKRKFVLLGVSGVLALSIAFGVVIYGNAKAEPKQPVQKAIHAKLQVFNFEDALENSDLVVKVEVEKKTRELSEPSPKTLFQAKILDELKADPSLNADQIHILQQGNSEWKFNQNDLFLENERYVLFLKKAIGIDEPNTYWILGEETGMYKDSGTGKLLKLSYYDKQLEDIEDKELTKNFLKDNENKMDSKEVQIVNEQQFKDKVEKILNN